MPQAMREQVPTSNSSSAAAMSATRWRSATTVAKLLAVTDERMDFNSSKPGAQGAGGGVLNLVVPASEARPGTHNHRRLLLSKKALCSLRYNERRGVWVPAQGRTT